MTDTTQNKVANLLNQLEDLAVEKIQRLEANNNALEERLARLEALMTSEATAVPTPAEQQEPEQVETPAPVEEPAVEQEVEIAEQQAAVAETPVKAAPKAKINPKQELAKWAETYPEVFILSQPKPLKIGIHTDLQAATDLTEKQVKRVLANYVKLPRYFACVVEGAERIDLTGKECGKVTAEEAAFAQQNLAKLKAKREEKAKRQAKHPPQTEQQTQQQAEINQPAAANQSKPPVAPNKPQFKSKPRPKKSQKPFTNNKAKAKPAPKPNAFTNNSLQEQLQNLLKK